jgi:mono/diheme cytochrome c family protein
MFRSIKQWCIGALTAIFVVGAFQVSAQDGGALFNAKCATCHQPHKDGTGPKLFQVRSRWEAGGAKPGSIYTWVANWSAAAASDPYAAKVSGYKAGVMSLFPELLGKKKDIDAILDWVDAQPDPATASPAAGGQVGGMTEDPSLQEDDGLSWVWVILGVVFITIIMAVGGVRRQLATTQKLAEGQKVDTSRSFADEFRSWAWKYKRWVGVSALILVFAGIVLLFLRGYSINVMEEYQPSQPIEFPHTAHAGKNGISCFYCHSSANKSKSAGLPTVNVCMNCHKQIEGNDDAQKAQISKIYAAAGWDPVKDVYTGKTKEIIWNKVHVLPDHVYFNHSQHVVVGGVDCKQCHGDMTQQKETAKVQPVTALNEIEGNTVLTKPTLTMGWCIECHQEKSITDGSLDTKNAGNDGYYNELHRRLRKHDPKLYREYLEDKKVSVKELGGWECAKCHY